MMLQEPLLLIGAFYLLFLVVIVYVRLDFAITKVRVILYLAKSTFNTIVVPCIYGSNTMCRMRSERAV